MSSQLDNLKAQLTVAIRDHVSRLPGKFAAGGFYGYALYTDDDASSLGPVANSERDASASAGDAMYPYYRCSPDEWKHRKDFGVFREVNQTVAALHKGPSKLFTKTRDSILRAALDALRETEGQGLFGPRSAERFVVLWVSDSESKMIAKSAKGLNSPAAYNAFKKLLSGESSNKSAGQAEVSLIEAARTLDNRRLRKLIAAGADVNEVDERGWYPLMAAITANEEGARLLIEAGASLDRRDRWGEMLLHRASNETTQLLLDKRVDVNATDKNGNTALHRAGQFGLINTIPLLLAGGADASIRNRDGKTALDLAIEKEKPLAVALLR